MASDRKAEHIIRFPPNRSSTRSKRQLHELKRTRKRSGGVVKNVRDGIPAGGGETGSGARVECHGGGGLAMAMAGRGFRVALSQFCSFGARVCL
jgi:chorismate synthase